MIGHETNDGFERVFHLTRIISESEGEEELEAATAVEAEGRESQVYKLLMIEGAGKIEDIR